MKATIVLIVLVIAVAVAVLAAQPADSVVTLAHTAPARANEPIWMVLSGAALLSLASALRRYMP
jgi:hypothetical protein